MRLLTVGSVAFDAIETPFGKTDKIVGGAGTFISLASSFFVQGQGIVSVVGDDFPSETLAYLNSKGIDTKGIQIKKGEKTFFWSGKYHNDMNSRDTLITELNVLGTFDPIIPAEYTNVEYLMLGNLSPDVQRKVIERLPNRPKLIAMDTMNFWMDIAMDELKKTMALVDVLIINDEEARQQQQPFGPIVTPSDKMIRQIQVDRRMPTGQIQFEPCRKSYSQVVAKSRTTGAMFKFHDNDGSRTLVNEIVLQHKPPQIRYLLLMQHCLLQILGFLFLHIYCSHTNSCSN